MMKSIWHAVESFVLYTEDVVEFVLKMCAIAFMVSVSWAIVVSSIYYLFLQ